LRRAPEAKMYKLIRPSTGYKSVKNGLPGPGSHDMPTQKIAMKQRVTSAFIGAEKGTKHYERETYATIVTKQKKFVPGVGQYNKENCYAKVATPYLKKRL
jgi:hypothetical protein